MGKTKSNLRGFIKIKKNKIFFLINISTSNFKCMYNFPVINQLFKSL